MRRRTPKRIAIAALVVAALGACGSRTGLLIDDGTFANDPDAATFPDGRRRDASRDTGTDSLPLIDARPPRDVRRNDCPDADATLVYVVTEQSDIYSYYPADGTFNLIGRLTCPAPAGSTPFSMAVDRKGKAFVVFSDQARQGPGDGLLYEVSTLTGACILSPFMRYQAGVRVFGMGFASNDNGPEETLFIASDPMGVGSPAALGTIDVKSFGLAIIGAFDPVISQVELTGTGDGRLFAFYGVDRGASSAIAQIDKRTGNLVAVSPLDGIAQGTGWAFAFWGGDFYTFTTPGNSSVVTRYRPMDNSITTVGSLNERIVGAGVSTCAPEQ